MSLPALFLASARFDFMRFLRSPALIYVALATPIAAYYMLPDPGASYAILTVNGAAPVLTASVLGLSLGVVAALLLTPLAYIFLKAGPTRRRPWQVSDVAPHSRLVWTFGRWISDTLVLWLLLAGLTVAGLILGVFKLQGQPNLVETIAALWLPAAPALALVAAIRLVLDARGLTRNWFGDVIFFVCWIALMGLSISGSFDVETGAMGQNPIVDAYGFAAPIISSVEGPVSQVSIIGASATDEIAIDAWAGVTDPAYLAARGVWLGIAAGLALFAGLIWAPVKPSARRRKAADSAAKAARTASVTTLSFKAPAAVKGGTSGFLGALRGEIDQLFTNRLWMLTLLAAAIAGALTPFRTVAGPALLVVLIFPLTDASARWQARSLDGFVNTLGLDRLPRAAMRLLAYGLVAAIVVSPAIARMVVDADLAMLPHALVIAALVPSVAVLTGLITRSSVTGRLILLIGWYAYLSSA